MITLSGPGVLYAIPATGTPCNFGKVTQVDIELSQSVKPITGGQKWPFDFAGGAIKGTAKAKMAAVSPLAIGQLFFGVQGVAGEVLTQYLEAGAVPANPGPYTVILAHPTTPALLEVLYAATGLPLQEVAAGNEAAGKFSFNAGTGTLTFAAADAGKAILTSYTYEAAGTGYNLAVTNGMQGDLPIFSAVFYNTKNGKPVTIQLPMLACEKLGLSMKEDAPLVPELDMLIGANAAGQAIVFNVPELS